MGRSLYSAFLRYAPSSIQCSINSKTPFSKSFVCPEIGFLILSNSLQLLQQSYRRIESWFSNIQKATTALTLLTPQLFTYTVDFYR